MATPEELVLTGEALLARPQVPEAPEPPHGLPPWPTLPPEPAPPSVKEPWLKLDALASGRWSGHVNAVWLGAALRVIVPLQTWEVGVWARYEATVAVPPPTPIDFSIGTASVGVMLGYRALRGPVELTVSIEPAVAVISMDGGPDTTDTLEGSRGDFRVGSRAQMTIPFGLRWRALAALDGELSPGAMASGKHRTILPGLPPIPSYMLGISLGGEMALR